MTPEELGAITARFEAATELLNQMHTERLVYSEYLTLIDSVNDIPSLFAEMEQLHIANKLLESEICCFCKRVSFVTPTNQAPCIGCKHAKKEAGE